MISFSSFVKETSTVIIYSPKIKKKRMRNNKESNLQSKFVLIYSCYFIYCLGILVLLKFTILPLKSEGHGFDSRWCLWNFSLT